MIRWLTWWLIIACSAGPWSTWAQQKPTLLEDFTKSAGQWARDNLDERALGVLGASDEHRVRTLFNETTKRLESTNIYALAPLKDTAVKLLPLLKQSKATRPYAEWLQNHLDYFEVSEELRRRAPPTPRRPGEPVAPTPSPTPETQR